MIQKALYPCLDKALTKKAGNMRKFPEVIFSACQTSALATCCNPGDCKSEKSGKPARKAKPQEH
jgi:hypothetical protein